MFLHTQTIRKVWHTTSSLVGNISSNNQKEQGIKHDNGGQILLEEESKKRNMKVLPVTRPSFHPTCKDAPLQRVRGQPAEGQGVWGTRVQTPAQAEVTQLGMSP